MRTYNSDATLFQLASPVQPNERIGVVCLPERLRARSHGDTMMLLGATASAGGPLETRTNEMACKALIRASDGSRMLLSATVSAGGQI